ncbi:MULTISPECIES: DUF6802 family protein [Gordonia]|uniref:DUF6802 family protein n=1 Tax=Gordonia amicalis TaxID=89053 RepID=A0AAE4R3T0_9ACTN|nr:MULTISPECIES: DUF6802 family protein [Gordonia]ATD72513.1 hypothetical protein CNO18_21865 [Gordonia sp. 1D]MCZ0915095.1 hypothetical protein [Gordonia amicalis]MDJ0455296.1 hypothetical protein [Gordonia amicalis]MDV6309016.1 DUF6802 family protein [Gordonia amicalis]MDV6312669.1 DUF6802 family protein [Gordonia amicalis]
MDSIFDDDAGSDPFDAGHPDAGASAPGGPFATGDLPGTGLDPHVDSVAAIHAESPADDLDDHLWMHEDGRIWDLGPAEVDTDNDGVNDSLTRNGPDGFTVYTDSDRDGQVDKITEIGADGGFRSAVLDPDTGEWISGGSGRIG